MNHIVEKKGEQTEIVNSVPASGAVSKWFLFLVFPAMLIHAFVAYAHRPFGTTILLELFFGMLNFAAIVMIYYGISRMAYLKWYVLLGISAAIAIALGAVLTKDITVLSLAAGWGAVLISPLLCGNFVSRQLSLPKVYAIALIILTVFVSVQLFPLWSQMIITAPEMADALASDLKNTLAVGGYTSEQIDNASSQFKSFFAAFVRVLPSFTVMAAIFQFTAGFWLFVNWLNRSGNKYLLPTGFIKWQMPFALSPILVAAILMRLFGNEALVMVADNLILTLAVFYSVAGISLVEFFIRKFRFAFFSKFLIYVLFLLTHVVGFAFLALLGFADSFFNWRRKYPLPLDYKTS